MSSPATPTTKPERVLVLRFGAMGDILHTLPAVAHLRRMLPDARIVWAVEPRWASLLAGHPALDRVVELPLKRWSKNLLSPDAWRDLRAALRLLRDERFDLVIDFQGLTKSALTARLSGAAPRVGFVAAELREPLAARFYSRTVVANRRHVVDKNLALARGAVGAPISGEPGPVEFSLPPGMVSPRLPQGAFLLASPFAGWRSKEWPLARYAELATLAWEQRRMPLALDCAPGAAAAVEALAAKAPAGAIVAHPSTLDELIGATRRARAVIGVDSGPLHLAAAVGALGVALFGPTDPARNGPYGDSIHVLRRGAAETTYKRGRAYSPSLESISAAEVWEALCERLDETRPQFEIVDTDSWRTGVSS